MPSGEYPHPRGPHHRVILIVDVEGSTHRTDAGRARMRRLVRDLMEQALCAAGVPPYLRDPLVDRGDGGLVLIRPDDAVPKTIVLRAFPRCLAGLLASHNAQRPNDVIRLRAVVHAGEVGYDDKGPFGEAVDVASRLVDADQAKDALRRARAPMVLVVSDVIYEAIVRQGYEGIDPESFSVLRAEDVGGRPCNGRVRPISVTAPELTAVRPFDHRHNGDGHGRPDGGSNAGSAL